VEVVVIGVVPVQALDFVAEAEEVVVELVHFEVLVEAT